MFPRNKLGETLPKLFYFFRSFTHVVWDPHDLCCWIRVVKWASAQEVWRLFIQTHDLDLKAGSFFLFSNFCMARSPTDWRMSSKWKSSNMWFPSCKGCSYHQLWGWCTLLWNACAVFFFFFLIFSFLFVNPNDSVPFDFNPLFKNNPI